MTDKMKITYRKVKDLKNYEKNPRNNEKAIPIVEKSIQTYGFRNPILIDEKDVIIAGHTRLQAAKNLKLEEVPTVKITDMTEEQVKAFRIMDNKSQEYALWDQDLLKEELEALKNAGFDLGLTGMGFDEVKLIEAEDAEEINIDGREDIITVNPPEAPRLKERFGFYFKNKADYDMIKNFFVEENKFNENKLLDLVRGQLK